MSITSVFTIGPFVPCTPICKILNTPVMSICLVKQNDGTRVEKYQHFLFNVYKRFFIFVTFFLRFLTFLNFFSWNVFYILASSTK